jgi:hypothetical protein
MMRYREAVKEQEQRGSGGAPACERFMVSDITVEALASRLQDAPRGLLLARDELDGWFGSFNQYKQGRGGDVAHYLSMYGGRQLILDRKTGDHRTVYVPRASLSVTGGIQPETLRRALDRRHFENGLAARFMFSMPPRHPRMWENMRPILPRVKSAYAGVVGGLLDLPVGEHPKLLRLSPSAAERWGQFFNEWNEEQQALTGDLGKAWSKLEGGTARLAMLVHLMRFASGDLAFDDPLTVDDASLEGGIALARWFANETRRVYTMISETEVEQETRRAVDLLRGKPDGVTARDWGRSRHLSSPKAEAELMRLVTMGVVDSEDVSTGGRPTRCYRLSSAYGSRRVGETRPNEG